MTNPLDKKRKANIAKDISDSIRVKGSKARDIAEKQNLKPIKEHIADKVMTKRESASRSISKRASDIEATVDKALKTGDKKLAKSSAKLAAAAGDTSLLKKLIEKVKKSKIAAKGLKSIPLIGTAASIASALSSGNAMAALPEEIKPTRAGPKPGTLASKLESGQKLSPSDRLKLKRQSAETIKSLRGKR